MRDLKDTAYFVFYSLVLACLLFGCEVNKQSLRVGNFKIVWSK